MEGTPRLPFGGFVRDLRRVELSLRLRRRRLLAALEDNEILPTVTTFPLMVIISSLHPWTPGPKSLRETVEAPPRGIEATFTLMA